MYFLIKKSKCFKDEHKKFFKPWKLIDCLLTRMQTFLKLVLFQRFRLLYQIICDIQTIFTTRTRKVKEMNGFMEFFHYFIFECFVTNFTWITCQVWFLMQMRLQSTKLGVICRTFKVSIVWLQLIHFTTWNTTHHQTTCL